MWIRNTRNWLKIYLTQFISIIMKAASSFKTSPTKPTKLNGVNIKNIIKLHAGFLEYAYLNNNHNNRSHCRKHLNKNLPQRSHKSKLGKQPNILRWHTVWLIYSIDYHKSKSCWSLPISKPFPNNPWKTKRGKEKGHFIVIPYKARGCSYQVSTTFEQAGLDTSEHHLLIKTHFIISIKH